MSGSVVLDTSIVVAHFRSKEQYDKPLAERDLYLPHVAIAELFAGAFKSDRPDHNRALVETFLESATPLAANLATAELYGRIWADLASAGSMIPQNDIWIAATALQHDLPLATKDAHFENIDGLEVEHW